MRSRLLVFVAILLLSVVMNSCQKSDAFPLEIKIEAPVMGMGMPQTLVQVDVLMSGELLNDQTEAIQTAAEDFIMLIESLGYPSMNPRIVIGCNVIYPRGEPMYRLKKKEEEI